MLRIVIEALPLLIAIYAVVDLVQTPDDDVQGLPKLVWLLLIVLVFVVGPVAWLLVGRRSRRLPGMLPRIEDPAAPRPGGRAGPVAPDDDPEFLRGLNRPQPRPPEDDESV
jgi:hypothetical protein